MITNEKKPIPYNDDKPYIFISYSHKDTEQIMDIISRLQAEGYRIWYDEGIESGTEYDEYIALRMKNSSFVMAFLSDNYMSSSFCKDELIYARGNAEGPILLVYLDNTSLTEGMKMRLGRLQHVRKNECSDEKEFFGKLVNNRGILSCKEKKDTPEKPPVPEKKEPIAPKEPATVENREIPAEKKDPGILRPCKVIVFSPVAATIQWAGKKDPFRLEIEPYRKGKPMSFGVTEVWDSFPLSLSFKGVGFRKNIEYQYPESGVLCIDLRDELTEKELVNSYDDTQKTRIAKGEPAFEMACWTSVVQDGWTEEDIPALRELFLYFAGKHDEDMMHRAGKCLSGLCKRYNKPEEAQCLRTVFKNDSRTAQTKDALYSDLIGELHRLEIRKKIDASKNI